MDFKRIHHEDLRIFAQQVIMKVGASEEDAYIVADNLVRFVVLRGQARPRVQ